MQVPEGWKSKTIDDVASVTKLAGFEYTNHFEYLLDGEIIAIRGLNIKKGKLDLTEIKKIKRSVSNVLPRSKLFAGNLVITYVGTVGNVATIEENEIYHLAPNVAKIYDFDKCYPKFISHFLTSEMGKKEIDNLTTKTSQPALSMQNIRKISLLLPPLPEQEKIAEILSTCDDCIEATDKQIAKLKDLKKAMMQELLTKGIDHKEFKESPLGKIPKSWEVVTLECITIPQAGLRRGPFGGALKKECFVAKGFSIYEQRHAIYGMQTKPRYFISSDKFNELKSFWVEVGDFIVSCSGTIGRISRAPENMKKGVINQALLRIRLKTDVINASFFLQQFKSSNIQTSIIDSNQGGAMKNLVGMSEFKETRFLLPPLEEQKKIADILSSIDDNIESKERKLSRLKDQKKALMNDLLTGKVRV